MAQEKTKYAVVDLEATSANSNAKIIQVGIVLIEDGNITQTYETDVNPHQALDSHIKELTGLTDERLRQAPDFSQVAGEIYERIHDAIFVAHNVQFDANLLAESLFWEGFDLLTPRIDTVELAQIFFPTFDKYNLGVLSQYLDIPLEHAHTALSDAYATALLFLKIQEKIKMLPKTLVEELLERGDCLLYESKLAIQAVFEEMPDVASHDFIERHGLFFKKPEEKTSALKLSQDFSHNIHLLGLEERGEQAIFAQLVEQALKEEKPSFLEGRTGIGKTYGYLLPLLAKTNQKIIVSVPTKLLQDQLMRQEGNRLASTFHISFHSLKSPRNYLHLDRFYETLAEEDNRLISRCKLQLLVWLTETSTGDLDEIPQNYRYQPYFERIAHCGGVAETSLFSDVDFWERGQRLAATSRVLVTNHAYLLTRLEDDKSLVDNRFLVVDEAQKLFLTMEQVMRSSLSVTKLLQEIQQALQGKINILEQRLLESLQFECVQLANSIGKKGQREIPLQKIEKIRQDLAELPMDLLTDVRAAFEEPFDLFWLEEEIFSSHRQKWLKSARLAAPAFADLLPKDQSFLATSATLEISKRVNLPSLLGFKEATLYRLPQSRTQQQRVWVDLTAPLVTELSLEAYAALIVERLEILACLSRPILVLFTSKDLLLAVSEALSLPHLAQYKNGDASNIKRRFDRGESSILLGAGSFWEGADFIRFDQMLVVITRLPFDNPSDHLTQKLNRNLKLEGKNPFYDYHLPLAILRLKQALGRTVRRKDQKSAVLLLDQRIKTKNYGPQIVKSLEELVAFSFSEKEEWQEEMAGFLQDK
ncbi:bifunctional DnaQ family exonuclease/ATP-dependent helicase [Streptococcus himalayensis]|uniref:3'-5' exonuclease DinG n=1 Tax=Streptococcus himalayensis TaxID=1888195 RepID=A0A917A4Z8_9STRE|nr:bifunctional DnaQ family exonuclease/ATP-dependent helicase [Streptococcus himalayensis]GGE25387.1 bifunctional DnaQ family exonuclease/ATP-dependent helicase [Streptococcus himalayensis]